MSLRSYSMRHSVRFLANNSRTDLEVDARNYQQQNTGFGAHFLTTQWTRKLARGLAAAFAFASLACNNQPPAKVADSPDRVAVAQETVAEAEALMESIQSLLQRPTGNSRVYEVIVKQLNEYISARAASVTALDPAFKSRVAKMLDEAAAEAADRKSFDDADADYIDNALFLEAVARSQRREEVDTKHVERLFDWVVRYIQLTPTGTLPEGRPKEVCIRGNGSADERAWVFLELLRQAGYVGCRIGVPKPEGDAPIAVWLCGAVVGKEILLFDPLTGVPLPSGKGTTATLKELAANPALANFLNIPAPLAPPAIRSSDLKKLSLLLIVEPPMLGPRMRFLQERLSGVSRPNLYFDVDKALGELTACLEVVPGNEGVRIWKYPQAVGAKLRTDKQAAMQLLGSLNAYWLQSPRSPRLLQLRGDHENAIRELVKLDLEKTGDVLAAEFASFRLPEEVSQRLISQTRQDIVYFLGLSKLDDQRSTPSAARDWFDRYLDKYSSPEMRMDDILNWPLFCAEVGGLLAQDPKDPRPVNPLAPIVFQKLSAASKESVKRIASDFLVIRAARSEIAEQYAILSQIEKASQEAGENGQLTQEIEATKMQIKVRREFIEEKEGPQAALKVTILDELNAMLKDKNFASPATLAALAAKSDDLKFLLSQDPKKMAPKETNVLNRGALDAAFPGSVIKSQRFWFAGALRNRAAAFLREGKSADAVSSIEKIAVEGTPFEQLGLRASVKWLKTNPK